MKGNKVETKWNERDELERKETMWGKRDQKEQNENNMG